ncbi:uracil-DNA glycosylase [uncultured Cohaesibacter sp.]|uniref:uracil-DNA glycosylase n=1 Tax=uncultured Cohaesibacter sp. TaxID=1002546 RepID=UPI0029C65591|nr:uracil-DNA glycosylase [uncultured Cohaesibacter sp.]
MTTAHDLKALLDWYEAMGADCAIDAAPQDRFAESQRQAQSRQMARTATVSQENRPSSPQSPANRPTPAVPSNQSHPSFNAASHNATAAGGGAGAGAGLPTTAHGAVEDARAAALRATSLDQLRQTLMAFDGCSLKFSAKNLVFGDGNPNADVMFIGEAPGRDEDLQGVPFVGRAGQLLDKMMAAIRLDRSNSYITNILPWRPPGNRKPSLDEQALMQPFIHRHIELVNPKLLVLLGGTSAQQLLDSKDGIMRLRGRWRSYSIGGQDLPQRDIPAMATLHPAFLLRTPAQKRSAWQDLLEVAAKLDSLG